MPKPAKKTAAPQPDPKNVNAKGAKLTAKHVKETRDKPVERRISNKVRESKTGKR